MYKFREMPDEVKVTHLMRDVAKPFEMEVKHEARRKSGGNLPKSSNRSLCVLGNVRLNAFRRNSGGTRR